jgi:two-component system OmpR family sensor kinase
MKLRRRLIFMMVGLLAVGLIAADVFIYTSVRSVLRGRVDEQLVVAQHQVLRYFAYQQQRHRLPTRDGIDSRVSPDVFVVVMNGQHQAELHYPAPRPSGSDRQPDAPPDLSGHFAVERTPQRAQFGSQQGVVQPDPESFLLPTVGKPSALYRATAVAIPAGMPDAGAVLVTAVSLNSVSATLDSLFRDEVGAAAVVIVVLCMLAFFMLRRGLRPLEDMATTAGDIAAGDLGQRVPVADQDSEVGRLGSALNVMLTRIEAAFNEQSAAEARLRQFVADASHELRTPLTSIQGYTELLRRGAFNDPESRDRALERVENEATRMSAMVDDLLLLARLDEGRPLDRSPVSLDRVATEAVEDAHALERDRPVTLDTAVAVAVQGDRDALRQVAHNLVRNALAHTPAGTPVHVSAYTEGRSGVLTVRDEGPGMSAHDRERVFDRFYQGDAARTGSGTGLGLAIVLAIAEALDGSATVDSTPGQGTTFTVRVPLAWTAPIAVPTPEPQPVGGSR